MSYIFGAGTGIKTPEEAARRRKVAEALAANMLGRAPQNIGEGLSAIGQALAVRGMSRQADRAEAEGRAAFQKNYGDLLPSLFRGDGGAADPVPTAPGGEVPPLPDQHPEYLTGGGMPAPNTQLPPPEDLAAIVRTVIGEAGNQSPEGQRAVAEVILNRARESGMTPQQVVSAKGQFEPWATRGAELNAIDPNSQQYQSVLGNITPSFGPDDPTGGADHFYSPGAQAALGRDAPDWAQGQQGQDIGDQRFFSLGYGGDPGASGAQDAATAQATGQPIQTAGLSITGSDLPQAEPRQPGVTQVADSGGGFDPRMIDALNDPWAPEGTKAVLGALLEQRMKDMYPPPADPFTLSEGQVRYGPTGQEIARGPNKEPDLPGGVREYQFAVSQGFPGTFQDWEASKKGGMSLEVDPATGAVSFQQGGNIKPLTAGQSQDTVFATRATGALPLIDKYGEALTNLSETVGGGVPIIGNYMKSSEFQQAEQAGREFLAAILRKDTGAAVTPAEVTEYGGTYLPQPGDKPPVLEQKRISRLRALEAIKAGMPPQAILAMEKAGEKVGQPAAAPSEGGLPEGVTEEDIQHTMQVHGWTREQVLERLNAP